MSDRNRIPFARKPLAAQEDDTWLENLSPPDRLALVWRLTLQAWAFKGLDHEPRLRRDVVRVFRRES